MATVNANIPAGASFKARFDAVLSSFVDAAKRRKVYRTTRNELLALSNRELADLGIGRGEIHHIAREAAETA